VIEFVFDVLSFSFLHEVDEEQEQELQSQADEPHRQVVVMEAHQRAMRVVHQHYHSPKPAVQQSEPLELH
jgi:hypothetical protein